MKKNILKKLMLPLLGVMVLTITSCDKVKTITPTTTEGRSFIKILNGGDATPAPVVKNPIDFVPIPTKLLAMDLRRDVATNSDLNKTVTVTVKDDTAAVKAANPNYVQLPTSWYTIQGDGVKTGGQGGTYTFNFQPGEFGKQVYITIPDATVLNPSALYGLGFTITSVVGGDIVKEKSVVLEIGAKNAWDGVYAVTGPMVDVTNTAYTQWNNPAISGFPSAHGGAWELHLITRGASQCVMYDNTIWGDIFHPMLSGTSNSGWGSYALVIDFNPATGAIADIHNYYGESANGGSGAPNYSAGNTRRATLDPSGTNAAQGNKDILIKYYMNMPSVVPTPPNIRVTFDEKWAYIGPR